MALATSTSSGCAMSTGRDPACRVLHCHRGCHRPSRRHATCCSSHRTGDGRARHDGGDAGRGRGLATALKRAPSAGPSRRPRPPRGGHDTDNVAMQPSTPDWATSRVRQPVLRGPLVGGIMDGEQRRSRRRSGVRVATRSGGIFDSARPDRVGGARGAVYRGGDPIRGGPEEERHYGKLLLWMVLASTGGFAIDRSRSCSGPPCDDRGDRTVAVPTPPGTSPSRSSVETVRAFIRIRSMKPPSVEASDGRAWRATSRCCRSRRPEVEIVEPAPGRGSVHTRLHGDGTGGEPLLLPLISMSSRRRQTAGVTTRSRPTCRRLHLRPRRGRHEGDDRDGARRRGCSRPRHARKGSTWGNPIPWLRRDILFTVTADEEAGGTPGEVVAETTPSLLRAAGALNECGGARRPSAAVGSGPNQVAEKGAAYRIAVRGSGHGDAARGQRRQLAAAVIERPRSRVRPGDAGDGPRPRTRRCRAPAEAARSCARYRGDSASCRGGPRCLRPMYARAVRAAARHDQSDVVHAGS